MTDVELVARALAASRTGKTDAWRDHRADALLIVETCASQPPRRDAEAEPAANRR